MNEYKQRINKVVDYIEANISKPLTLDELACVASFGVTLSLRSVRDCSGNPFA